jgi:hypothetical protein
MKKFAKIMKCMKNKKFKMENKEEMENKKRYGTDRNLFESYFELFILMSKPVKMTVSAVKNLHLFYWVRRFSGKNLSHHGINVTHIDMNDVDAFDIMNQFPRDDIVTEDINVHVDRT